MKYWMFLGIAIIGEVIATSTLKASEGFSKLIPSIIVTVGYLTSFYFLSLALKSIPVGVAYAVWAGIGVVLVTIISWATYDQKLDFAAIIGMVLIISGVIVMNLFSKVISH
ncbi:DMT family transporter [Methylomonas sp. 2BW1-5-20]|uniref:DMT family transporter n=1 Tax=Methylomonas sp. 2BW1-5-20 TaxID=3376686 RepID=UPI0040508992